MALTPSSMLPLGTTAPAFRLPNVDGKTVTLDDFSDATALVVVFMCNHCPFVQHLRSALASFGREVQKKGAVMIGINSNDVKNHPDDSPARMVTEARTAGYTFPYLFDESQEVARAYRAACTPDFFLFDRNRKLAYRGQFDDSRPGNGKPITGADLRAALDAVVSGNPPRSAQKPSIGCNIKWKPGNEPDYA